MVGQRSDKVKFLDLLSAENDINKLNNIVFILSAKQILGVLRLTFDRDKGEVGVVSIHFAVPSRGINNRLPLEELRKE